MSHSCWNSQYIEEKVIDMGQYYEIIDGKRYDAALIRNGEFRIKGVGDGRISFQDAQDLWQLAIDGGRITETERSTIHYLMDTLNWTDPATDWMKEQLAREIEEVSSYYKIIEGLRYDRKILNEADRLIEGQGDGRISLEDAELLLPMFDDFGDVTIVEERTLAYLLESYKWTDAAQEWFTERVGRISKQSDVTAQLIAIMKFEYGFSQLRLDYFTDEALQQMLDYESTISLPEALRFALQSLLNDTNSGSFGAIISGYTSDPAKDFLEGGRLVLLPGDMASEPSLSSFPSPLNGESLTQNWIFGLELFDLSDDIYWIIVSRDGSKLPYNYIGGPNVEEEWPRPTGEAYFTILVKSCDEPYPGITVDVQDPDGNYTVGKSDVNGEVQISGPAGLYSIYASDGWSFQSKSFDWDGKGIDQTRAVVLDC